MMALITSRCDRPHHADREDGDRGANGRPRNQGKRRGHGLHDRGCRPGPREPRIRHRCAAAGSRRARRQASANASRAGAVGGRPSGDRGRRPRSKAPVHLHIDERLGRRADDTGRGVPRGRDDRDRRLVQGVRQRGVGRGRWPAQDEPAVPRQDRSHLPDQPPERQRRGGRGVHGADAQLGVRPPLGAQLCQGDHEVAEGAGERGPAAAGQPHGLQYSL